MSGFKEIFQSYIGKKIVLYGLGTETERILHEINDDFHVVGLLDSFRDSGELYGRPILTLQHVAEMQVTLIVVVARPGSCKAIVKQIKSFCAEYKIELFDIRGKNLMLSRQVLYNFRHVNGETKTQLLQKASQADTVSFDLFDTLVMRKVISYTDIFELMEYRLLEKGWYIPDFSKRRLFAEKELAKNGAPTLEDIYKFLLNSLKEKRAVSALELAELEWEIDFSVIVPRESVFEIFRNIIRSGKKVYIVTDTYYKRSQIEKILKKCGAEGYTDIVASCEYQTGKCQGLFPKFIELYGIGKCLHIGDDYAADIEAAEKCGMNSFRIYSSTELLEELGMLGLEKYTGLLTDRIKLGFLAARLLNDPFQFEDREMQIEIMNAHDVGYILCAPMICDFLLWFYRKVKQPEVGNIWFSARDGYLIQKLYRMIDDSKTEYFLTSRIAAIRAGMVDLSDVNYVDSMKFSGTIEENLRVRFGIEADQTEIMDDSEAGLKRYTKDILRNAALQRDYYEKYMNTLSWKKGDIAFFDFVAKGTTQMYVRKLIDQKWQKHETGGKKNRLKGFYFLQLEPEFMSDKDLDIESFYKISETEDSVIFENYYILETILTAPHPMVLGFDKKGKVVYAEETRSKEDILCSERVQKGIEDYFRDYLNLVPRELYKINKKLDETVLGLIRSVRIVDEGFLMMMVEDPFFNRMTKLADILS